MTLALFNFFDLDQSGEVETHEIVLFEKPMFGKSKEDEAKKDAKRE